MPSDIITAPAYPVIAPREYALPQRRASFLRDLAPAAGLLLVGLAGLLAASASGPGRSGQYLVVAAPWSGLAETMAIIGAADGGLVEIGGFGNIAVAASAQADFGARARQAGAWIVLPAPAIPGCFAAPQDTAT